MIGKRRRKSFESYEITTNILDEILPVRIYPSSRQRPLPLYARRLGPPSVSVSRPVVASARTLALAAWPIDGPSRARRYDTSPATKGAAIEVPLWVTMAVSDVCEVVIMLLPGAQISTADP